MKLGLISCTKSKQKRPCKACEMYKPSALFRKAYSYAIKNYDRVAILSAKYGLLLPDNKIEPYDLTLKNMSVAERRTWADRVFRQMKSTLPLDKIDEAFFHAGRPYRELLIPKLETSGVKCFVPLKGLSYGRQLAWYDRQTCCIT